MANTFGSFLNISFIFLSGTNHPQKLLQTIVTYIYQIGMRIQSGMMIVHFTSGCDNRNSHSWESNILHELALGICYSQLVSCGLVILMLDLILLGEGRTSLSIWIWCQYKTLAPLCCLSLGVWWYPVATATLVLPRWLL